jgi:hypothetical protein
VRSDFTQCHCGGQRLTCIAWLRLIKMTLLANGICFREPRSEVRIDVIERSKAKCMDVITR